MATTVTTHITAPSAIEVIRIVTVDGVEAGRAVVATVYEPGPAELLAQALGTHTAED
jgi:hypothetical protein